MINDTQALQTLVHVLRRRAHRSRDRLAFGFMSEGETVDSSLTYRELDSKARGVAAFLEQEGATGERVLLVYPPGLDFIVSLFGCLYAGAVAVPAHRPTNKRLMPRLETIVSDVEARLALTISEMHEKLVARGRASVFSSLPWFSTDQLPTDSDWDGPEPSPDTLAIVQYTSGSTTSPKGVLLRHGNIQHNLEAIRDTWHGDESGVGVFWLPLHHDMGLIGAVLETVYVGGKSTLMSPPAFVQRPMRWLEALSRTAGTISAAPGFAYDLCVTSSTPEERAALDLSSFRTAMCGAETVRSDSLKRFAKAFAGSGFRADSFYPVYGLAEATLMVSGRRSTRGPVVRNIRGSGIRGNKVIEAGPGDRDSTYIVGCGRAVIDQDIVIVDPDTSQPCPPDRIGEIWVSGPNVAQGYWGKPAETARTFGASLPGADGRTFLRTGDLGFLADDNLFVVGRLKDLIIIRGRNYYPDDIEASMQGCHPALLHRRGAAFSVRPQGRDEQLVIVQEVDRRQVRDLDVPAVCAAIRHGIAESYDIQVHAIVLVQPLRIATTSSGKIQRHQCREDYLEGRLDPLGLWRAADPVVGVSPVAATDPAENRTAAGIEAWLIRRVAAELDMAAGELDPVQPFAYYGLDSVRAVRVISTLQDWLGRELSPTLAYDYPSVRLLATHLAATKDAVARQDPAALLEHLSQLSDHEVEALLQRMLASQEGQA